MGEQVEDRRILSSEVLFEEMFDVEDVDLGRRGVIKVRSLSRAEVHKMRGVTDADEAERRTLALALVQPQIDEVGAGKWQEASRAGEIRKVIDVISRISGLDDDSEKDAYKSPDDGSEPGV